MSESEGVWRASATRRVLDDRSATRSLEARSLEYDSTTSPHHANVKGNGVRQSGTNVVPNCFGSTRSKARSLKTGVGDHVGRQLHVHISAHASPVDYGTTGLERLLVQERAQHPQRADVPAPGTLQLLDRPLRRVRSVIDLDGILVNDHLAR